MNMVPHVENQRITIEANRLEQLTKFDSTPLLLQETPNTSV